MNDHQSNRSGIALGLPDAVVLAAVRGGKTRRRDRFAARLDALDLDFVEVGLGHDPHLVDLLPVDAPSAGPNGRGRRVSLDGSVSAATVSGLTSSTRILTIIDPLRDHPYNIARKIASLDHESGGRIGWAARFRAAGETVETNTWSSSPQDDSLLAEQIVAVRKLWQTWPLDSVLDDRERGIFVDSSRIVFADHVGQLSSRGPLNVPSPPQGAPVVAVHGDLSEHAVALDEADLLIDAAARSSISSQASRATYRTRFISLGDVSTLPAITADARESYRETGVGTVLILTGGTGEQWLEAFLAPRSFSGLLEAEDSELLSFRSRLGLGRSKQQPISSTGPFTANP